MVLHLPNIAYSILLACAFGACKLEEDPKHAALPVHALAGSPSTSTPTSCSSCPLSHPQPYTNGAGSVCNNATLSWMLHTLLTQISQQNQLIETLKHQLQKAETESGNIHSRNGEVEKNAEQDRKNHASCLSHYEQIRIDNIKVKDENEKLKEENEKLKRKHKKPVQAKDCSDIQRRGSRYSGLYSIYPDSVSNQRGIDVFCDLDTDGGGWTVIQRRQDGTQRFNRPWDAYKKGFGQLAREFWLGNEYVHVMTSSRLYELRVDMLEWSGEHAYALYDRFALENEEEMYMLRLGTYTGTAGDALSHHADRPFSTLDVDNDLSKSGHCSQMFGSAGWWYVRCYDSNLNGIYKESENDKDGIIWYALRANYESLQHVEMKIRPAGYNAQYEHKQIEQQVPVILQNTGKEEL